MRCVGKCLCMCVVSAYVVLKSVQIKEIQFAEIIILINNTKEINNKIINKFNNSKNFHHFTHPIFYTTCIIFNIIVLHADL